MKDIRIGGKSINAKEEAYTRGHYIVDSGTTDSYLPRAMKNEFLQVFKEVAGRDYQVGTSCHGYTNEDLASLPKIQLVMEAYGDENGEVIIDIPPEQYLLHNDNSYCGSIYLSENAGGVIGANLMMNRDVIFDNGNQRVGFVDADCAYQGGNSTKTTPPSIGDHITSSSNSSETTAVPAATAASNASVPASTSAVAGTTFASRAPTAAPTAAQTAAPATATTTAPKPVATPSATVETTPEPTSAEATSAPTATAASTPKVTEESIPEATSATATSEPVATAAATPATAVDEASIALDSASSNSVQNIQPLSEEATTKTQASSSADAADLTAKEKSSGTHPMVLTIVGAVLVVGFL